MAGKARESAARQQGFKVIGDAELLRITEGRVAQLEQELHGHRDLLAEMEADPHQEEDPDNPQDAVTRTRNTIESIETRLKDVLHPRLEALRTNVREGSKGDEEAPAT